jgi:hypothetical protein
MSEKSEKTIKELGFGKDGSTSVRKIKVMQPETPSVPQGRDLFQTPNYAVDLLIPFIPKNVKWIWECASGDGKISNRLYHHNYNVWSSDIRKNVPLNFLTDELPQPHGNIDAIITNPPFSLKQKFYYKCLEYKVPFALLIPAEYCGWLVDAVRIDGAEKIIPNRRIDFITPSGLSGATGNTADFHSMWLTWGFGLGRTETYVELSLDEKKNNI